MDFIKSVAIGTPGSYKFFGTDIEFADKYDPPLTSDSTLGKLAIQSIYSKPIAILRMGYLHALVHEMAHALSFKQLTGRNCKVDIFQGGSGDFFLHKIPTETWKQNVVHVSGPLAGMTFYSCKILVIAALKSYLTHPAALNTVLALSSLSAIAMTGELLANFASLKSDKDFGAIAKSDTGHFLLALATLTSLYAVGLFGAWKLLR